MDYTKKFEIVETIENLVNYIVLDGQHYGEYTARGELKKATKADKSISESKENIINYLLKSL